MKGQTKINLLVIAFRNLSRHKVKTIITVISVVVGVSLYIFMDAWLLGMKIDSIRNIINFETGSVKIYSRGYFEKKDELPSYETFNDYDDIVERLHSNGWNAAPRFVFAGSLISPFQEMPGVFIGVDPELEKSVLYYKDYITEGRSFTDGKFEIIIGSRLARNLQVKAGDLVRLSTVIDKKDENGKLFYINQLIDLTVVGIINSPNPKNNSTMGYLPISILQGEMGMMLEGAVTEIIIRKKDVNPAMLPGKHESKVTVSDLISDLLPSDLIVTNYQEDVEDFFAVNNADDVSTRVMIGVLFLLAFLGIANTMLMAVLERTKEIGMLRSMGMTDFSIIKLFLYEAGAIGFIGSLIGLVIGVVINIYMVNVGWDLSEMMESAGMGDDYGYRVAGVFKSAWNYGTIIGAVAVGTILSALTAIPPVIKTLNSSIVDALRFE